jgi:hypothetical protein
MKIILLGNHYNEALRQAFNGSKEFVKAICLEIGKAQIRGVLKVP